MASRPAPAASLEPAPQAAPVPPELPAFVETVLTHVPFLRAPVVFGFHLGARWGEDACPLMAAALAFFGLLSMFPLALAAITVLAHALADNQTALQDFAGFAASFFPGAAGADLTAQIERGVTDIAESSNSTRNSLIALVSLLWAGRAYFDTLVTVLVRIFPGDKPRSLVAHQLRLWSLLLGAGALFLLSSGVSLALSFLQELGDRLPNFFINRSPVLYDLLGKGAGYALTFLMFYLLYRYAPTKQGAPRARVLWIAATVGAVGWEVGKWAFGHFLGNVARYQAAYGSVAGVIVTMLWIFYASMIVLLGAEVGATLLDLRAAHTAEKLRQIAATEAP